MKMQCELLNNKFDDQETTASAVDLIKSMTGGTCTHHAGALKLALREGFSSQPGRGRSFGIKQVRLRPFTFDR
jgi:hypothetical protein